MIFVDADACPVLKEIITVAGRCDLELCVVSNYCHQHDWGAGVKTITVDKSPEAVDIAIMNHARDGDIVVTQDYGLACMLMGKRVRSISPRGRLFHEGNIDVLMQKRHLARIERKRGHRTKGPRPFTSEDRKSFTRTLEKMIKEIPEGEDKS